MAANDHDEDTSVRPGDVLGGKYRVERVLGAGGMGIVVSAQHTDLGAHVAVKLMRRSAARDPESVERFVREARAAVQLRSEHCAHVLDVGKLDDGAPYIVMELLQGRDLAAILAQEGARPAAEAIDTILQACEGLAEAHGLGIVHRDLKPQNLFVTRRVDGRPLVKVLDFGLAKTLATSKEMRALTQTTAVMGSPQYMSPEQMRASRDVDARSDIWSLGVVLYEMLVGKPPFDSETLPELCSMVLKEPPTPMPTNVPRGLVRAAMRCLEKDTAKRFQTIADLADALESFATTRGAAERVRAVLETPRQPLQPTAGPRYDRDAETRSATSMDTFKRPAPPRGAAKRGGLVAASIAIATVIVTVRVMAARHEAVGAAATSAEPATTTETMAAPSRPSSPASASVAPHVEATPPPTASPPVTEDAPAAPRRPPPRPGHPRAAAPARPASAPAPGAPLLTPKTTEF